jgi:DNA primase
MAYSTEYVREENISIKSLLEPHFTVNDGGTNWLILCPFHGEKTASLCVDKKNGQFYCFGCHKGGGIKKLLEFLGDNSTFIPVIEIEEKVERPEVIIDEKFLKKYWYCPQTLVDAGFSLETLMNYEIGFDIEKNRNIFPIRNEEGELVGVSGGTIINAMPKYKVYRGGFWSEHGKWLPGDFGRLFDDEYPNYGTLPKTKYIWNYHKVFSRLLYKPSVETIIVVEGFKAALWLLQHGYENVVALMGTVFSETQDKLLSRLKANYILFLDNDEAGINGSLKAAKMLKKHGEVLRVEYIKNYRQPDDFPYNELVEQLNKASPFNFRLKKEVQAIKQGE